MDRHPLNQTAQAHPRQEDHFRRPPQGDQMAKTRTYTIDQIAIAARELREAAGTEVERFTSTQVIDLLGGEIQILRERGFSDDRITGLLAGFDIELKKGQIDRRSRAPGNFMRRLLWDRTHSRRQHFDDLPSAAQSSRV